jgi:hypothetical protein
MKTDGNGWKSPISIFISIFFSGNSNGFGEIQIQKWNRNIGRMKTDQYNQKFNRNGSKAGNLRRTTAHKSTRHKMQTMCCLVA